MAAQMLQQQYARSFLKAGAARTPDNIAPLIGNGADPTELIRAAVQSGDPEALLNFGWARALLNPVTMGTATATAPPGPIATTGLQGGAVARRLTRDPHSPKVLNQAAPASSSFGPISTMRRYCVGPVTAHMASSASRISGNTVTIGRSHRAEI